MIKKETIKKLVDEEYNKNILNINDFEAYSSMKLLTPQQIKLLAYKNAKIIVWIKHIIETERDNITATYKLEAIKEIINKLEE